MQELDDNALLRKYVEHNSVEAFATLVTRHINKVYSVALRHTGNPHQAEEITQAVFVILARKSGRLSSRVILSGWLYQTARLTAVTFIRSAIRRARREQEAYMQSVLNESESGVWTQIAPLLDAAMAGLNETDRHAVLLRFFDGKSMGEIGAALGANEAAVKKRVSRALEKLQKYFTRNGIASTADAIAGAISANSVQAAPALLAKTVTAVAVAKGAAAGGSTLTLIQGALKIMAWTKAKTAVVAGAALILTTGTSIVVIKAAHSTKAVHLVLTGLPQTSAELNAWYVEPPAGQNAATFNLQGIKAMQVDGADQIANLPILGKLPPPPPGIPLSLPVKSALTAFVQRNREALQFFAQGAQYEQSRYPIDLTKGPNTLLPHLFGIKRGMQMAEMAAILDAENKDEKTAADDILLTLTLARSLKAEPVLISQLVRAAGVALAVDGLNQVVNRTTLPPESLSELSKAFQSMEDYDARGEGFNRAMAGERAIHLELLKNPDELVRHLNALQTSDISDEQRRRMIEEVKQPRSLKEEQDYFETTFQQLLSARQESFPDRLKVDELTRQRATKASGHGLLFNGLLWGGVPGAANREASCLADLRLALTAVALEQFRATHNQYPTALSELAPNYLTTTPVDPFDGRPLRYRKQVAGYVLYSIGPDLKDNGGKRTNGNGGDIVFTVVTPPA